MPWWPGSRYPFDILLTNASYSLQTNNSNRRAYIRFPRFKEYLSVAFHERFDTLRSLEDSSRSLRINISISWRFFQAISSRIKISYLSKFCLGETRAWLLETGSNCNETGAYVGLLSNPFYSSFYLNVTAENNRSKGKAG